MLSVPGCFVRPKDRTAEADSAKAIFKDQTSDHITLIKVYNDFIKSDDHKEFCMEHYLNYRTLKSASDIRNQLTNLLIKFGYTVPETEYRSDFTEKRKNIIIKAVVSGYFAHVAHLQLNNLYFTVRDNQIVSVHPSTSINTKFEWLVYHEFILTKTNYIRTVSKITNPLTLFEVAGNYYGELEEFPNGYTKRTLEKLRQSLEIENENENE